MKQQFNYRMLLAIGLLIMSASMIIAHFVQIKDIYRGGIMGVGIGLMILAIIKQRRLNIE